MMMYRVVRCKSFRAIMILNRLKNVEKPLPSPVFLGGVIMPSGEKNKTTILENAWKNASDARYAVQP